MTQQQFGKALIISSVLILVIATICGVAFGER